MKVDEISLFTTNSKWEPSPNEDFSEIYRMCKIKNFSISIGTKKQDNYLINPCDIIIKIIETNKNNSNKF